MGVPRLSRTIKSLLEKRGIASGKAATKAAPSVNEVATPSSDTTTTPTAVAEKTKLTGATFSASDTLTVSSESTSAPRRKVRIEDYTLGFPGDIADQFPPDLRKRIDRLQTYWGADDPGRVIDHIIYLCLQTPGYFGEQDVETMVQTYLDAVGLV